MFPKDYSNDIIKMYVVLYNIVQENNKFYLEEYIIICENEGLIELERELVHY